MRACRVMLLLLRSVCFRLVVLHMSSCNAMDDALRWDDKAYEKLRELDNQITNGTLDEQTLAYCITDLSFDLNKDSLSACGDNVLAMCLKSQKKQTSNKAPHYPKTLAFLLKYGSDPNMRSAALWDARTPLENVICCQAAWAIRPLIAYRADVAAMVDLGLNVGREKKITLVEMAINNLANIDPSYAKFFEYLQKGATALTFITHQLLNATPFARLRELARTDYQSNQTLHRFLKENAHVKELRGTYKLLALRRLPIPDEQPCTLFESLPVEIIHHIVDILNEFLTQDYRTQCHAEVENIMQGKADCPSAWDIICKNSKSLP